MSEGTPEYGTGKADRFAEEIEKLERTLQLTTALRIAMLDYFTEVVPAGEREQLLMRQAVTDEAELRAQIIKLEKEKYESLDSKVQEGPAILENEEYNLEHIDSETIRLTRRR